MSVPKGLKFSFAGTDEAEKALLEVVRGVGEKVLSPVEVNELADKFVSVIGGRVQGEEEVDSLDNNREAMRVLLVSFLSLWHGRSMTDGTARSVAARVACCRGLLRRGVLPDAEFAPGLAEWSPVQIAEVDHAVTKTGKSALRLLLNVRGGRWGGLSTRQIVEYKYCMWRLGRELGLPRFDKIDKVDKNDLVGFRFGALLQVRNRGDVSMVEYHPAVSAVKHNRELAAARCKPCPRGYRHLCSECPVGYAEHPEGDPCSLATHPRTFRRTTCRGCDTETWVDVLRDDGPPLCEKCRRFSGKGSAKRL